MFYKFKRNAKAYILGSKDYPKIKGTVDFKQTNFGVLVTANIYGLPKSGNKCTNRFFGFHIHEGSSCTGNKNDYFFNTKQHLNLNNCPHPFHTGDLPPLIENNGYAYMSVLINKFTINDIVGKTIVIHDMPDNFTTQPSRKFRNKNCLWAN